MKHLLILLLTANAFFACLARQNVDNFHVFLSKGEKNESCEGSRKASGAANLKIESTPKSLKVDFQLPSNLLLFGVDSRFKEFKLPIQ
jgi:hypothetical protein